MAVIGLSSSSYVLVWACGKEVNDPEYTGVSVSFANIGGFVGAIILGNIYGVVLEKLEVSFSTVDSYNMALIVCLIGSIIGFVSSFFIKETNLPGLTTSLFLEPLML